MGEKSFNPDRKNGKESVEEIKRELAMRYQAVADHYEEKTTLNNQDLMEAEEQIQRLKQSLIEKGE